MKPISFAGIPDAFTASRITGVMISTSLCLVSLATADAA